MVALTAAVAMATLVDGPTATAVGPGVDTDGLLVGTGVASDTTPGDGPAEVSQR
jgi:hypothetical protein